MNRICKVCNMKTKENNYLKDRIVCKKCHIENRRKKTENALIQNEQHEINMIIDNHNRTLLVGPIFWGETNLMLKIFSRLPNRVFYIITKSLLELFSSFKIKIKEK